MHQKLLDDIKRLDMPPEDLSKADNWLAGNSHLAFLKELSDAEEMILAASGPCTIIRSVAIPVSRLEEVSTEERARWPWLGGEQFATYNWTREGTPWVDRFPTVDASTWFEGGRPLAICRLIEARASHAEAYWEPDQEFLHVSEAHWREERHAYARLTMLGDWLDVVTITNPASNKKIDLVTCNRDALDDYLVATESVLILLFDLRPDLRKDERSLLEHNWTYGDTVVDNAFCHRTDRDAKTDFTITLGTGIIHPKLDRDRIADRIRSHGIEPSDPAAISLLAADQWQHNESNDQSTPVQTTKPFRVTMDVDKDDGLVRYSPAFFNSEVLSRYTADPDRWSISKGKIHCRGGWELREYHMNGDNQIWALIEDLRRLPRRELEHWQQYNEPPRSPVTKTDLRRTFWGELPETPDPLSQVRHILSTWTRTNCSWWKLREDGALERLTIPIPDTRKAWGEAIVALDNVVSQGFVKTDLIARFKQTGRVPEQEWGSIRVLEELLTSISNTQKRVHLNEIKRLRDLRNQVGVTHPTPDGGFASSNAELARYGSYAAAYEHLCQGISEELQQIEQALAKNS